MPSGWAPGSGYGCPVPSANTLAIFAAAVVIFAVVPGPAVFYVVTRSLSQGRKAGAISAGAIATGNTVHVVAATVGLSALLASSAIAFSVVKYLGAAYLVYLGIRVLRGGAHPAAAGVTGELRSWRVFRQGVVVAVLNPKTALFFLALLPQFVEPGHGPVVVQLAVLGLVLVVLTLLSDTCYALLTGSAGLWLRRRSRALRYGRFATGGAYVTLGMAAAVAGDPPRS